MQNIFPILSHNRRLLIKIGDFGAAKISSAEDPLTSAIGTFEYGAPEIFSGDPYTDAVDIWSLGILSSRLWTGKPLFPDPKTLFDHVFIQKEVPNALGEGIKDQAAIELISWMIQIDPQNRPSAEAALSHEWFQNPSEVETQGVTLGLYSHFVDVLEGGKIPQAVEPVKKTFETNVPSSGEAMSITFTLINCVYAYHYCL